MTPIIATVQKPVPKPDREVLPSQAEADTPNPPEAGSGRDFGAVLRAVADTADASRAGTDPRDAAETTSPPRKAAPAEAVVAALPPADPTNAAAMLATILTAALPAAAPTHGPASDAGGDSGPPKPVSAAAASGRGDLSGPAGASAPASTAGFPAGTGSAPEAGPRAGQPEMARGDVAPLAPRDGSGLGRIPKVEILDRAVHFKPVLPGAAPPVPAVSAAITAVPADADAKLQPVRTDGPASVAAKPERVQAGLPDLAAAAASKIAWPSQPVAEPRPADAARPAAPAPDTAVGTTLDDNRAIAGIARAVLAAVGRRAQEGGPVPGGRDGAQVEPGLPAIALPTIAAAIREEIDRAGAADPQTRVDADPAVRGTPDGPLRVLRIQLRPEELGTVTVELRLANGQLETHLRASRPETAAILHKDAAILTDLLKQAHYRAEVIVGQTRPAEAGSSAGGSPSQGQPSFTDGGARPGQGGDRQRQAAQRPAAIGREGERADETVRPRDGGVYL